MQKSELRKLYLQKRLALPATTRMKYDELMLQQLRRLALHDVKMLLTYFPYKAKAEPNTFLFTEYLLHRHPGLQLAYPVINTQFCEMQAMLVDEHTHFVTNAYGIAEPDAAAVVAPTTIDVLFIPLLCFDSAGFRVGYGKGYYDKFLMQCRQDVIKIGFSYFAAIDAIHNRQAWDIPLDYCLTPNEMYAF